MKGTKRLQDLCTERTTFMLVTPCNKRHKKCLEFFSVHENIFLKLTQNIEKGGILVTFHCQY